MNLNTPFFPPTLGPFPKLNAPVTFFDDFLDPTTVSESPASALWLIGGIVEAGGGGTTEASATNDAHGGHLTIETDNADGDGCSLQSVNELIVPKPGRDIFIAVRFKIDVVADTELFLGLSETDTNIAANRDAVVGIGFDDSGTGGVVQYFINNGSSEDTGALGFTMADDTWCEIGIHIRGTESVTFTINDATNDAQKTIRSDYIPVAGDVDGDIAMHPSIDFRTDTTSGKTLTVDYFLAVADRE